MHLDMQADVTVKDTRPFVAVLDNLRDQHGWVDALLTVEDLGGHVALSIDGDTVLLREAMLSGPEIGVHAKGRSSPVGQEGMLLVRWQNLSGAMALQGKRKHFDVLNARSRFDAYTPGRTPLPFLAAGDDAAITAGEAEASAMREPPASAPQARRTDQLPGTQGRPSDAPRQSERSNPFLDHSL